jgi:hypothetical protein
MRGEHAAAQGRGALEAACGRVTEGLDTALVKRAYELIGKRAVPLSN